MLRGTIIEAALESSSRILEVDSEGPVDDYDSSDGGSGIHTSETDTTSGPADSDLHAYETDCTTSAFNHELIWISVVLIVLIGLVIFCCKGRGAGFVEEWTEQRSNANGDLSDVGRLRRMIQRRQAEEERKKECPERRKERLNANIEMNGVALVVKESDFAKPPAQQSNEPSQGGEHARIDLESESITSNENDAAADDDDSSSPAGVNLPPAAPNGNRTVPNCCAVCLCRYDVGDSLVWSCNAACQHAFHRDCAVEWLGKVQNGTPCPCCRQEFTDLPPFDPNGDKEDPLQMTQGSSGSTDLSEEDVQAFSVGAISFR